MDKENAKPAQEFPTQNIPLLQAQHQPVNQYYAPYSPQVQQPQQQINQQPYISNPYQGINLQGDQNQGNQPLLSQQNPQQQQIMQPYQPNPYQQQVTGIVLQQPFISYTPQVLQNASGFRTPALVQCPYCNQHSITTISYKPGNDTYWMAVLLCICFGLLCLIPLLSGDCKDVYHQCSYCGKIVGHTPYKACS